MKYKLTITNRAEELLEHISFYIVNQLKNPQAAVKLMDEIECVYDNLEYRPMMYAYSEDTFLKSKGYRKAVVPHYDYLIIFRVDEKIKIFILLVFFMTQNYTERNCKRDMMLS